MTLRAPERQARTYALINSGTSYGVILSAPIAYWAGHQWQLAWLVFAAIAAVATGWNSWVMPSAAARDAQGARHALNWRWLFQPRALPLFGGALLFGLTSAVYWTFAVDLVTGHASLASRGAQLFWLLLGIAGIIGGSAGDGVARLGLRTTFRIALIANAIACALLGLLANQSWAILISAVLFGSTFILITGLFGIWSVHVFQKRPSAGFGVTFFLISAGQLISPAIAGATADLIGMAWIFNLTAIATLAVIGFLPSVEIRRMSDANRSGQ